MSRRRTKNRLQRTIEARATAVDREMAVGAVRDVILRLADRHADGVIPEDLQHLVAHEDRVQRRERQNELDSSAAGVAVGAPHGDDR